MSGDNQVSHALEALAPRVICGWTARAFLGIVSGAGGRIGLCRSATRASAGRLYARAAGPLSGGRSLFAARWRRPPMRKTPGGLGGRAPRGRRLRRRHLLELQVLVPKADRHCPVEPQLDDHPALAQPRVDWLSHLVDPVLEP